MTEEDGTGLADADTYVDPAGSYATGYALSWLRKAEWTAADAATKEAAVISATRVLDAQFDWIGVPANDGVQALGWPRYVEGTTLADDIVPIPVQAATMEMALALLQRDRTSDTGSGSQGLKSLSLGDGAVKLDYGDDPSAAPVESIVPAFVRSLLRDYGDGIGGSMVKVERR